jgi:hypothetical protein
MFHPLPLQVSSTMGWRRTAATAADVRFKYISGMMIGSPWEPFVAEFRAALTQPVA